MLAAGYAGKLPPAASDYVGAILESVERLSKLINDVLDLTQGDTQGVVLERERVDIAGMCRAAAEALRGRADEKAAEAGASARAERRQRHRRCAAACGSRSSISCAMPSPTPTKAGTSGSRPAATTNRRSITIVDDGPGIAARGPGAGIRALPPFRRDRGEAALGLGLPLTRQFVEAHGGTVELESALGKGTSVTITIPRAPQ